MGADLVRGVENPRLAVIEAEPEGLARAGTAGMTREDDGRPRGIGSHIWLDPVLAQAVVSTIAAGLARADPAGAADYAARADQYNRCSRPCTKRYGPAWRTAGTGRSCTAGTSRSAISPGGTGWHLSPYSGFSPNAAPTPAQMTELVKAIRTSGQTTLFVEELLDPKVGRTLAGKRAPGWRCCTAPQPDPRGSARGDVTYLSLMHRENLAKLRKALGCRVNPIEVSLCVSYGAGAALDNVSGGREAATSGPSSDRTARARRPC